MMLTANSPASFSPAVQRRSRRAQQAAAASSASKTSPLEVPTRTSSTLGKRPTSSHSSRSISCQALDPWATGPNDARRATGAEQIRPTGADNVRDFDGGYGGGSRVPHYASAAASASPSMDALLAELSPDEQRTVKLFQENSRSVVNVSTTMTAIPLFSPFNARQMPRGVGSGFIFDRKGHVITNAHVIGSSAEVNLTLSDGTTAKAKVVGKDREKDVAVIKITNLSDEQLEKLRPVTLGSSSNLLVGQKVFAIGNPFGLDQTLTQGIVSGLGREVGSPGFGMPSITNAIQSDAAINPGNSGGPLLDSNGRVVGINTAILDPTGVGISSGVGFAIPIDSVRGMVDQILSVGRVVRPALGITIAPLPQMMQLAGNGNGGQRQKLEGVLVVTVRPGGPADVAGVQPTLRELFGAVRLGDIITAVNGKPVKQQKDLYAQLDSYKVGDAVELTLLSPSKGNAKRAVRVVLADRERLAGAE